MSASQAIAGYAGANRTFGLVVEALRRAVDAALLWRRRRRAVAALHALSDRTLADIAVARSEIEGVVDAHLRGAAHPAGGKPRRIPANPGDGGGKRRPARSGAGGGEPDPPRPERSMAL